LFQSVERIFDGTIADGVDMGINAALAKADTMSRNWPVSI
jgi:hypothetical protein